MPTSRCDEADAWLEPHRAPLIGFVLPLVNGDLQAAEDVVQETMLRGWQHSTELEPEKAGSWLHTVARNIAISAYHRRRRNRPREVPLDENALPQADDGVDQMSDAWLLGTRPQFAQARAPGRDHGAVLSPQDGGGGGGDAWHSGGYGAVSLLLRVAGPARGA